MYFNLSCFVFFFMVQQGNTRVIDGEEWEEVPRKNTRIYYDETVQLDENHKKKTKHVKHNSCC